MSSIASSERGRDALSAQMSRRRTIGIVLVCLSALASMASQAWGERASVEGLSWDQLSDQQRAVLAPLEATWSGLPEYQRRRLVGTADAYPGMGRLQQQRLTSRLLQWSQLSLEQRNLARARFKEWKALPSGEREKIEQRWHRWLAAKEEDIGASSRETSSPIADGPSLREIDHGSK